MLEKPDLADAVIIAGLRDDYNLPVTDITFLPVGYDSRAWVYRVATTGSHSYFLKVRKKPFHKHTLMVARHLYGQGITEVVAPLFTNQQMLWHDLGDFVLIVYPFIDGDTGLIGGMTDAHWIQLGAVMKRIHATPLHPVLAEHVPTESFSPKWRDTVRLVQERVTGDHYDNPMQEQLALFWHEKQTDITQIVERCEALGHTLQQQAVSWVLCHADIHIANVMIDRAGQLWIVDWDEALLAPIERDLMFAGDLVDAHTDPTQAKRLFFTGYGEVVINPVALAYYRYEWVVQEIGDFGERIFLSDDAGHETQEDAVQGFMRLFQPGDVVEAAYAAEAGLPENLRLLR